MTGGSSGIGRAIALRLGRDGWDVAVAWVSGQILHVNGAAA